MSQESNEIPNGVTTEGMRLRQLRLLAIGVLVVTVGGAGWWLLQRMTVGSYRHALNHPEYSEDTFSQQITGACKGVNNGNIWIANNDPRYVPDRMATSNNVYRYIVLDSAILNDSVCLVQVINAAANVSYPISIALSGYNARFGRFSLFVENK